MSGRIGNRFLKLSALAIAVCMGLAAAARSQPARAEDERDFIFTDDEGHLVLRFAGSGPDGPDAHDLDEVVNASFSTMVHDRLRADLVFESEPVDSGWAASMEPRIESRLTSIRHAFSSTELECRSTTCRLVMEHTERRSIAEHQALMEAVQRALEPLTGTGSATFDPVFLIAAYEQRFEMPLVKVYLHRATARD